MANISTDFSTWSGTAASNQPDSGDTATVQADLQAIQAALRTIFPSVNAAVTPTHTELNYVDGVTSAIQTQLNDKAALAGGTFTGDISVPDEAYGVGWNGSLEVPTKNAIYDKIETIGVAAATTTSSGIVELATSGEVQTGTDTTRAVTVDSIRQGLLVQGTYQSMNTLSSQSWTGIPSWAKRVTIMFQACSLSGTDSILVQAIVGGSPVTSGYVSTTVYVSNASTSGGGSVSSGFACSTASSATALFSGIMTLTKLTGNTWVQSHTGKISTASIVGGGGDIDLAGGLEGVKVLTNGANTYDGGYINVMWE